jgi:hypothetical protein
MWVTSTNMCLAAGVLLRETLQHGRLVKFPIAFPWDVHEETNGTAKLP